jgi:cell wall-associated NlpC family hydrolase
LYSAGAEHSLSAISFFKLSVVFIVNPMKNLKRSFCLLLIFAAVSFVVAAPPKVLGRLGQSLKTTSIYTQAKANSKAYYKLKAYEYIIVRSSKWEDWYLVPMQNGKHGYVLKSTVVQLPYNVTANQTQSGTLSGGDGVTGARAAIANHSLQYIGTPYKFGGNDLHNGIDCSGFVKKLYGKIGIELPRTAAQQALVGQKINRLEDLKKGDRLYFWEKRRNKIGHTGIYLGNGYFAHASSGRKGVATDSLTTQKWRKLLVAARR